MAIAPASPLSSFSTSLSPSISASRRWEKVREYEPSNQDCYNGLATALFIAKDYDKSEEVLTAGYKLFPKNINIIFNLGNLYLRMDRREQSLHFLQLTMELDPNYRNVKTLIEQKFKDITN